MRWYKNVAVHSVAFLTIAARKSCASSARGSSVSTATVIIIIIIIISECVCLRVLIY